MRTPIQKMFLSCNNLLERRFRKCPHWAQSLRTRRFSWVLSQISDAEGASGMVVDFVTSGSEGCHDRECDY
jgi:hypothetical protein